MRTRDAMKATLAAARAAGHQHREGWPPGVDFAHLESMVERADPAFSEGKVNRWLGYMQGVLVATGTLTLDQCKAIKKEFAG